MVLPFGNISKEVIQQFFLEVIKPFGKEDLKEAVEKDISLLKQASEERPRLLNIGEKLAKKFSMYSHYLTPENVMKWLKKERPDFYQAIKEDGEKERWLRTQVKEIKTFLFS